MTEKRYMIEEIGSMFRVLKDNEPLTTKFENYDKQDVTNLIAELNELADENQFSKEFIEQLQEELVLFKEAGANMGIDLNAQITALKQENEQLKQQLELYQELYPIGKWITELTTEELEKELI